MVIPKKAKILITINEDGTADVTKANGAPDLQDKGDASSLPAFLKDKRVNNMGQVLWYSYNSTCVLYNNRLV